MEMESGFENSWRYEMREQSSGKLEKLDRLLILLDIGMEAAKSCYR